MGLNLENHVALPWRVVVLRGGDAAAEVYMTEASMDHLGKGEIDEQEKSLFYANVTRHQDSC